MSNEMLDAARAYARMGWKVFPLHTMVNGACSCGKACSSPAKHPRTQRGFKDATTDPAQIRRFWNRYPDANIGISTGSGLVVIDIDGEEGAKEFKELVAAHGPPPATLVCKTGNGFHLFYLTRPDSPSVRSSAVGKVHIRGEGGYVVASPSRHASGKIYTWIKKLPVATLPDWLRQWSQGYEISGNNIRPGSLQPARGSAATGLTTLGQAPAYLQNRQSLQPDVAKTLSETLRPQYSTSEQARLISALAAISVKACGYDDFLRIGMALKELDWAKPDGTDIGFEIWDAWCAQSEHHNQAGLEAKWRSFRRSGVSIGTVYHLAQKHGWSGIPQISGPGNQPQQHQQLNGHANGVNGNHALPAAFLQPSQGSIFFPDRTEEGKTRSTMLNTKVAIGALTVDCRYDLFHNRMLVNGEAISKWNSNELSDHVVSVLRDLIRTRFGFDPGKQNTQDAAEILCLNRMFDPILDYLDALQWDGVPRLDKWMVGYLGAPDTDLNHAIGRLSLIAAVRRARHPGTKFDQIIVLEGPQGQGKSEAIEILAGADNFSDQSILGVDDRKQLELTEGVWLYEIGELNGIRRADIESIKAFASRKTDRARPAYGRYVVQQPRRTVFFASCNRDDYLQDDTGNRRFWPVVVRTIDLNGLRRDRDQLWAEAASREASGELHVLPERLWAAAGEEQHKRMAGESWLELIHRYLNMKDKEKQDVSVVDVLCDNQFIAMRPDAVKQSDTIKAGRVLAQLKFERYQKRLDDGTRVWRYRRPNVE